MITKPSKPLTAVEAMRKSLGGHMITKPSRPFVAMKKNSPGRHIISKPSRPFAAIEAVSNSPSYY